MWSTGTDEAAAEACRQTVTQSERQKGTERESDCDGGKERAKDNKLEAQC